MNLRASMTRKSVSMKIRQWQHTAPTSKVNSKGKRLSVGFQVTVTLVKKKGNWQLVAAQATRIA